MKTYEEMAERVLKRSEEEIERRSIRRRKTTRIVSSLSCFCIIVVICIGIYHNRYLDFGKSLDIDEQIVATREAGGKQNETNGLENYKYSVNTSIDKEQSAVKETKPEATQAEDFNKYEISLDSLDVTEEAESFPEITIEHAINNARALLNDKEIETITNLENPKVEEMVFEGEAPIHLFNEGVDATGKKLYKIIYNTEQDGLLGPITFYVDKISGIVIGADYRE